MNVKTRISPSPTGLFHVGTARTALFSYLYAKKNNGTFIVRFEDTDKERNKPEFEKDILDSLLWLGIVYDTVTRQSERQGLYKKEITRLVEQGNAYESKEKHPKTGIESTVIRFKNTHKNISFKDTLRGVVTMDISDLGDFIIGRGDGSVLYNFAVVVDDYKQKITHIIRGDDHISNTPRQVALQEALGYDSIQSITHIPLIHDTDGSKLSKRKASFSVLSLKDQGYLPEAVLNYLVTLGWTPRGDNEDREMFSLEEMTSLFSLENLSSSKAIFNPKKLEWYGKQYFQKISKNQIVKKLFFQCFNIFGLRFLWQGYTKRNFMIQDIQSRCATYSSALSILPEYMFLYRRPTLEKDPLTKKGGDTHAYLQNIYYMLGRVSEWNNDTIKTTLMEYANATGRAQVLWPFRYLLTGREKSPDGIVVASCIGKKETLIRIKYSLLLL